MAVNIAQCHPAVTRLRNFECSAGTLKWAFPLACGQRTSSAPLRPLWQASMGSLWPSEKPGILQMLLCLWQVKGVQKSYIWFYSFIFTKGNTQKITVEQNFNKGSFTLSEGHVPTANGKHKDSILLSKLNGKLQS